MASWKENDKEIYSNNGKPESNKRNESELHASTWMNLKTQW
jgi:hypothetical protein